MATIPELLDGHVTLEVECLDRLYLNGYIGKLATGLGLVMFMREQLQKPVPSPVVLGQISERFREAVRELVQREQIPFYEFRHKEDKDEIGNAFAANGVRGTASFSSGWHRRKPRPLMAGRSTDSSNSSVTKRCT
jgi:hypothetical protein